MCQIPVFQIGVVLNEKIETMFKNVLSYKKKPNITFMKNH